MSDDSDAAVLVQELTDFYTAAYCGNAAAALLLFDWLLCLDEEVAFIWKWRSRGGVTVPSLVYAFTRYGLLIEMLLAVGTNFPMSDLAVAGTLGMAAFSSFSALRAYALSSRNIWLTATIILLALPPVALNIYACVYQSPVNSPPPFNCGWSTNLSPTVSLIVAVVWRGSQVLAELLAIGITWWYSYESYRIRKDVHFGQTVSSVLIYNGSTYFLFLATLYILHIIFNTATVPDSVVRADTFMTTFFDPMASILTCRFILLLRQFDNHAAAATTRSFSASRGPHGDVSSTAIQFAVQPSTSLPASIQSFAHPIYLETSLTETDSEEMITDESEWLEMVRDVGPTRRQEDGGLRKSSPLLFEAL